MFPYSKTSQANYNELHPKLQKVLDVAKLHWNHSVLDGGRTMAEQIKNVAKNVSKTLNSKHLFQKDGKSHAMDVMPYPYNWDKIEKGLKAVKEIDGGMEILEVYMFQGFIAGIAAAQGTDVRQGSDWNTNRQFEDQTFHDLPHTELDD